MLRIHDTALGRTVPFEPREPGKVSMYVCGPTVDEVPHIGHGRFALVFDVIRRYLEWRGFEVHYVSNITDIEDKIINRANEQGRPADEVTAEYEKAWWEAMDGLGVRRPDDVPHATGYVDKMISYISELIDRRRAYETPDGVYFSVESLEDYGLLAFQSLDSLKAGGGDRQIYGEDNKRHPFDFALWKKAKPGEPAWDSPWEPGRPGWHIECTVMALDLLGEDFDIHGGGDDLRFPHHENERAQAVGGSRRFCRHWIHNGMVMAGGQKMSKSLRNYTSLADLLDKTDPRAYRILVLRSHYRSPIEVTPDTLDQAERSLDGLDNLLARVGDVAGQQADQAALDRFRELMDEDFDTPGASAHLFDLVRRANAALDAGRADEARSLAAAVVEIAGAVGLELKAADVEVDDEAAALARDRDEARAARDWAQADALRDELVARGWTVEDTAEGTRLRR